MIGKLCLLVIEDCEAWKLIMNKIFGPLLLVVHFVVKSHPCGLSELVVM